MEKNTAAPEAGQEKRPDGASSPGDRVIIALPWEAIGGPDRGSSAPGVDGPEAESELTDHGQVIPGERWLLDGSR